MKTREEIVRSLAEHKADLASRFKVRDLALFGSYSRGDAKPDSDVDILVDVDPSIGLDFVSLAAEIETFLGTKVDLISRRAVKSRHMRAIRGELIHV